MISRLVRARASVASGVGRSSAVLALAVALVVVSGGFARADTDPASTYLVSNQVFLSSQSTAMSSAQRQLVAAVAAANRAGFAIRVAVISSSYDLGSVPRLWNKPRTYAQFLGAELSLAYRRQRLLVVMPNGFGFNWPGHATAPAYGLLVTVPPDSGTRASLARAAEVAVRRLARASGVVLPASPAAVGGSARRGSAGTLTTIGAIAGVIAALFAFAVVISRARRRPALRRERREVPRSSRLPRELRWAIPGLLVLCGVAVAAPLLLLVLLVEELGVQSRLDGHELTVGERGDPTRGDAIRDCHGASHHPLWRNVIRPRVRSYGETVTVTRSPARTRMRNFRIFPAAVARTMCPLSSSTRNMALGSTSETTPSRSIPASFT